MREGVFQVMVANIRCAEIMEDQLRALAEDQAWLGLRQEAASGLVPDFGTRAAALLDSCLSGTPSDQSPLLHGQLVVEITHNNPCFVIFFPDGIARDPGCPAKSSSLLGCVQGMTRRQGISRTLCAAQRRGSW